MGGASALNSDGLTALMATALQHHDGPLGVALSGGGDSLAALSLAARVAPGRVRAATVDHRLRPESAEEAAKVGQICASLAIDHVTLTRSHGALTGNLQDQARQARYDLLAQWAMQAGLQAVLLGHNADDQAECLLMGLSRAAGLDGLAGMRPRFVHRGVTFLRPLLTARRGDLRHYLTGLGLIWIEDPSNDNDRFARVRFRKALSALAPLGLTVGALAQSAGHLAQARRALDHTVLQAFRQMGREQAGALWLDRQGLTNLPAEIQRRLLAMALRWVTGQSYAPRGPALMRALQAGLAGKDATLHGARLRARGDQLQITREARAVAGKTPALGQLWDNRWQVTGPLGPGQTLGALGGEGLRLCPDWRSTGLPREVLIVSPAVWQDQQLIAAPLAKADPEWQVFHQPFDLFILSH